MLKDQVDTTSVKDLVIVNKSTADREQIIAQLNPDQEVLILDAGNGLTEIIDYLTAHAETKYGSIHFLTHGNDGYLSINGEIVSNDTFDEKAWAEIGEHLTDDGDILFYGCNTAKNENGKALIQKISAISGADVAASDDVTGVSGDWDLEYVVGVIDEAAISIDCYNSNFTNYNVTSNADSGDGTLRWAINQANANAGTDEITFNGNMTITLSSQLPKITDSVNIVGNGVSQTIITGNSRFFELETSYNSKKSLRVNISNISVRGGVTTYNGGGICCTMWTNPDQPLSYSYENYLALTNCDFSNCNATQRGGALYAGTGYTVTIQDSVFKNNKAGYQGTGAAVNLDKGVIVNSTFDNNTSVSGGGSYSDRGCICFTDSTFYAGKQVIINCSLANNTGLSSGSSYAIFAPNAIVVNTISVGNESNHDAKVGTSLNNLFGNGTSSVNVNNTFAEVSSSKAVLNDDGTFHIKTDGLADQTGVFVWHNADYSAIAYSTTIDGAKTAIQGAVDNATILISTDQTGTPRGSETGKTSIGAKDRTLVDPQKLIVTTTRDIVDSTDGYTSLREAMSYAATLSGAQTITFNITDTTYAKKSADYLIINSELPTITKALTIDGTNLSTGNNVTISVANPGMILNESSGEWEINDTASEYRIVTYKPTTEITAALRNLTLIGGDVREYGNSNGGVLDVSTSGGIIHLSITDVSIQQGVAVNGGGIRLGGTSELTIKDSNILYNYATNGGGLFLTSNGIGATIKNSVFTGNKNGGNLGAAIRIGDSNVSVDGCIFTETQGQSVLSTTNATTAGFSIKLSNSLFYNNNISDEVITGYGGAGAGIDILNCTVVNNAADGIDLNIGTIRNTVVWGNTGTQVITGNSVSTTYSAIQGWTGGGTGNIKLEESNTGSDPNLDYAYFVDPENGDYHLDYPSSLVDRGNDTGISATATDLDGNTRIVGAAVDIGAYERKAIADGVFYCSSWTSGADVSITWHDTTYDGKVGDGAFFNDYDNAKSAAAMRDKNIVVLESTTLSKTVSYDAQNVYLSSDEALYTRMVIGGELKGGNHLDYAGSYTVNIEAGTFASDVAGGDAANGYVLRTGNVTVNVSGGTFAKSFTAGSYYATEGSVLGVATIYGDVTLTISGGSFDGRVYGGCGAMTDTLGSCSSLQGDAYLTIDASTNAISFGECIAAGNRGHGALNGSTNVTVTGQGANLTFADESVLFGGCSGDYYSTDGGVRTASTSVTGARKLAFDNFTGDFGAEIRMFSDIKFANNTNMNFSDAKLDLKEMGVWNFDCTSFASNLNQNQFAGDTINVDTTDLASSWTLLSGDAAAFADLGSAQSVSFSGSAATWSGSAWSDGTYTLALDADENKTSLIVSKIG